MSYGKMGQQRSGTPRMVGGNPRPRQGGAPPQQTMRGYGPTSSTNTTSPGVTPMAKQKTRGFRQTSAKTPQTTNTSAGRIKKGRA